MFVVWDILYFIAGCVAAAFGYKSAMGAGAVSEGLIISTALN